MGHSFKLPREKKDRKGASLFPLKYAKWRKLWGRHVRKKNAAYFRREATASVVEIAKSITKTSIVAKSITETSIVGPSRVQDSLTGG